jgi:UDP-N-acetylmuramate dehydrogenase
MGGDAVARAAAELGALGARDVPLAPLTTFRVGGPAALFVRAESVADLGRVRQAVAASGLAVLVVGQGSNLLVADAGFPGIVVTLGDGLAGIDIDETTVRAGGGVKLPVLARRTAAAGLTGLEWAVGVPGSVGGAVRMNAGGHGSDVAAVLVDATLVRLTGGDGCPETVPSAALGLGYRRSVLTDTDVVVAARFGLRPGDRAHSELELAEIVRWRREHQPGGANCGSVFANPPGDAAGRLVDAAGCKGLRVGTASVSTKHANFIQADDGARAADVLTLVAEVRRRVHDRFGVWLRPEVRTAGFDPGLDLGREPGRQRDGS